MPENLFDKFPQCVLRIILEYACSDIVEDCRALDIEGIPRFGLNVRRFVWLLLVNKRFHSLLMDTVRVENKLIRNNLLDMQADAFRALLYTRDPLAKNNTNVGHSCHKISELRAWCACGPLWKNPGLSHGFFWFQGRFERCFFAKFVYYFTEKQHFEETDFPKDGQTPGFIRENASNITLPHVVGQQVLWEIDNQPALSFTVGGYKNGIYEGFEADMSYTNCVSLRDVWIGRRRTEQVIRDDNCGKVLLLCYAFHRDANIELDSYFVINREAEAIYDSKQGSWYQKAVWDRRDLPQELDTLQGNILRRPCIW